MRVIYFFVEGAGNFPFEMLAYDRCWPADQDEADKIRLSCPTVADLRRIVMSKESSTPPTSSKWMEYHWTVIPMGVFK